MRREPLPDVLHLWDVVWTKRGDVWEGPPVSDPTSCLPYACGLGRIEVRGDRYVMVDSWLTLARFGWTDADELVMSPCVSCRHKHATGATCTAFPEGIPDEILFSRHDHRTPYAGDHGIQYEAAP